MNHSKKILYRLVMLQGISLIGSRLTAVAIGIWLVKQTGNVTPLLLISLFNELPLLFVGTWIGLAVDLWKRKTAIIVGDAGQAVCTLLLVLSLLSDSFMLWHVYTIVAIQGLFMALQSAASEALVPMMVKHEELDRVNSIKVMLFPLASVIAPLLAGMLFTSIGIAGIVMIDFVTFILCAGIVIFMPLPELSERINGKESSRGLWAEALQGYKFIWKNKALLYLFIYFAWWNFLLNGPLELAIPYFLLRTESDTTMSWLLAAMNAGALAGAAGSVAWGHFKHKIAFILAGSMLTSVMFIIIGISHSLWTMGAALFLLMFPLAMTGAMFNSIVQTYTPLSIQGRVFTSYGQLTAIVAPLSFVITGPLVDKWLEPTMQEAGWPWITAIIGHNAGSGIALLFVLCGLLLAAGILCVWSSARFRHIETMTVDTPD